MLSLSRLVVFLETSQTLPPILSFTAIAYKQTRIVAVNETQTRISCLQARSKMLCAVDYIFNLLCAFNCLQPMKKFVFSVASRATGRLQIKPSGSGDENVSSQECAVIRSLGYFSVRVFLRWELCSIFLGKNRPINSTYDLSWKLGLNKFRNERRTGRKREKPREEKVRERGWEDPFPIYFLFLHKIFSPLS